MTSCISHAQFRRSPRREGKELRLTARSFDDLPCVSNSQLNWSSLYLSSRFVTSKAVKVWNSDCGRLKSKPSVMGKTSHQSVVPVFTAVLGTILSLPTSQAFAGGFQVNEQSARASARMNAVVATVHDPSSIFYNPAGLASIRDTEFLAGSNVSLMSWDYAGSGLAGAGSTDGQGTDNRPVPFPYAYIARVLSDKAVVGLGFYTPFGYRIAWDNADAFVGRTQIREAKLQTYFFSPTVALKLSERISIAVGVSLVPTTYRLVRSIDPLLATPPVNGQLEISSTAFGVGATAGVQISLTDQLHVGFSYRSAVDLAFSGDGDFTLSGNPTPEELENYPDQTVGTDLTLPHSFDMGVAWTQGALTLEVGALVTLWNSFDQQRINFDAGVPVPVEITTRDWNNSALFKFGLSYQVGSVELAVGGGYDLSPVPDTTLDFVLPDGDRILFSAGAGYDFGAVRFDIAYSGGYVSERALTSGESLNIPMGGVFSSALHHLASASVGFHIR